MAAVAWTDAETKAILTIWGTELVQKLLAKATRNKNIYEIVSKELSKVGEELEAVSRPYKEFACEIQKD